MVFLKAHLSHKMNDPEFLIKCLIDYIGSEMILKKDDDAQDGFSAEQFDENKDNKDKSKESSFNKPIFEFTKDEKELLGLKDESVIYDLNIYNERIKVLNERRKRILSSWKKLSEIDKKSKWELIETKSKNPMREDAIDSYNALSYANSLGDNKEAKQFLKIHNLDKLSDGVPINATRLNKYKKLLKEKEDKLNPKKGNKPNQEQKKDINVIFNRGVLKLVSDEYNQLRNKFIKLGKNKKFKNKIEYFITLPAIVDKNREKPRSVSHQTILSATDTKDSKKIMDMLNDIIKKPAYKDFLRLSSLPNTKVSASGKKEPITSILSNKETISGNLKEYISTYGADVQEQIFESLISELNAVKRVTQKLKLKGKGKGRINPFQPEFDSSNQKENVKRTKEIVAKIPAITNAISEIDKVITELNSRLTQARKERVKENIWTKKRKEGKATKEVKSDTTRFFTLISQRLRTLDSDLRKDSLTQEEAMVKFLEGQNKKLVLEVLMGLDSDVEPAEQVYPEFGERTPGIQLDPSKKVRGTSGEKLKDKMPIPGEDKNISFDSNTNTFSSLTTYAERLKRQRQKYNQSVEDKKERQRYKTELARRKREGDSTPYEMPELKPNKYPDAKRVEGYAYGDKLKKADSKVKLYTMIDIKGTGTSARKVDRDVPYNERDHAKFKKFKDTITEIGKILNKETSDGVKLRDTIKTVGYKIAGISQTTQIDRKRGTSALQRLKSKKSKTPPRFWGARAFKPPLSVLSSIEELVEEQIGDFKAFNNFFITGAVTERTKVNARVKGKSKTLDRSKDESIDNIFNQLLLMVSSSTPKGKKKIEPSEEDIQNIKSYYNKLKEVLTDEISPLKERQKEYNEIKNQLETKLDRLSDRLGEEEFKNTMQGISSVSKELNVLKKIYNPLFDDYVKQDYMLNKLRLEINQTKTTKPDVDLGMNKTKIISNKMITALSSEDKKAKVNQIISRIIADKDGNVNQENYKLYSKGVANTKSKADLLRFVEDKMSGPINNYRSHVSKIYDESRKILDAPSMSKQEETKKIVEIAKLFKLDDSSEKILVDAMSTAWSSLGERKHEDNASKVLALNILEIYKNKKQKIPEYKKPIYEIVEDKTGKPDKGGNYPMTQSEVTLEKKVERQEKTVDKLKTKIYDIEVKVAKILENIKKFGIDVKFVSTSYFSPEIVNTDTGEKIAPKQFSRSQFLKLIPSKQNTFEIRPQGGPSFSLYQIINEGKKFEVTAAKILDGNFSITADSYADYLKVKQDLNNLQKKINRNSKEIESKFKKLTKTKEGEEE